MSKITEFEQALVHRDNITKKKAQEEKARASEMLYDILAEGGSYDEVEDMLADEFGLEMDYVMDLL